MLDECDRQLILFGISLLILLILTTIIYRALFPNPNQSIQSIENYDGKISNITLNQCGTECTIGGNCRAFAYKPVTSTCYLSKKNILGQPVQSAYVKDYSKLDQRCNKINPLNDINFVGDVSLTANSVYVCSDGENNKTTQFQYANLGSSSLESADVVGGSAGRGVPTHIGDIPDYAAPLAVNYDVFSIKYVDPEIEPLKDLTPNFVKLVKQSDAEIRLSQTKTKPDKNIVVIGGELETARSAFIESDMEFLGQYMLGHQCVVNVPFYDCIKFCDQNDKCAGTEWNEAVIRNTEDGTQIYSNVCCPKQLIKKIVPRRTEHSNGKFYIKTDLNKIKGRDSILLSRQNVHKPLGISDLSSTIDGKYKNPRFSLQVTDRTTPDIYLASQQSTNDVMPLTNIILPGDNEKINLS